MRSSLGDANSCVAACIEVTDTERRKEAKSAVRRARGAFSAMRFDGKGGTPAGREPWIAAKIVALATALSVSTGIGPSVLI